MRQINQVSLSTKTSTSSYSVNSGYGLARSNSNVFAPSTPSTPSWPSAKPPFGLQRSMSSAGVAQVIETGRGFKPSDRRDPQKCEFLTDLTKRVFKVGLVSFSVKDVVNLGYTVVENEMHTNEKSLNKTVLCTS